MNGLILSENNIDTINKENNKMDEEANGSAESIDNIASKLTEKSAADGAAAVESNTDLVEPNAKSVDAEAIASEEPIAAAATVVAPADDAAKVEAAASDEPMVAATDAVTETKTDDDKVLADEAKPEEIAQIIESLDLPPAAVEKIDKPSTPKHSRDEDDLDDDLEDGARNAKKMRLVLNDEIDAAIASLPATDVPAAESEATEGKIDVEPATEPTPIDEDAADSPTDDVAIDTDEQAIDKSAVDFIVKTPIDPAPAVEPIEPEVVAAEPTPIETVAVESAKVEPEIVPEVQESEKSVVEPTVTTPIESEPATKIVEEAVAAEPTPIESVVTDEPAKVEPVVETAEVQVTVASTEPIVTTPQPVEKPVEAETLDIPVPEFLAENLTALIPADLLPAVNESDMAPAVTAPLPLVNPESMTVEEPEPSAVAAVDAVEENAEKMDAAPINDDQMDVDDAADAPMDL